MRSTTNIKTLIITRIKMGNPFEKIVTVLWVISLFVAYAVFNDQQMTKFMNYFFIAGAALMIFFNERLRRANEEITKQKLEIEYQKKVVEEKNREITDSINYALRIQTAILPPPRIVQKYLTDSFILYKPKDIVSGDFYWMETIEDITLFAACDCTGHGVPGALVSMVCHNALNRAVREFKILRPAAILDKVNDLVISNFENKESQIRDGMDISLCALHTKKNILQWAGAHNPLWLFKKGEFVETKADKQSIGNNETIRPFTNHEFSLKDGDAIYIFSDGYSDQFGAKGKGKITKKRFRELIISVQDLSMEEQGPALEHFLHDHQQETFQTDDILVMGIKI